MIKPIPSRLRIGLFLLGALLGVGLVLAGYGDVELTAKVEAPGLEASNSLDAKELLWKVKLFNAALRASRRGFIRLSEVEINSYLDGQVARLGRPGAWEKPTEAARLVRCRADLTADGVTFYSWLDWHWKGHVWRLCWRRRAVLRHTVGRWEFAIQQMRVGDLRIPSRCWSKVEAMLRGADRPLAARYAWLTRLPAVAIGPRPSSHQLEVRLYTFADAGALRRARR